MAVVTVKQSGRPKESIPNVRRIAFEPPNGLDNKAHLHIPGKGYRIVDVDDIEAVTGQVIY